MTLEAREFHRDGAPDLYPEQPPLRSVRAGRAAVRGRGPGTWTEPTPARPPRRRPSQSLRTPGAARATRRLLCRRAPSATKHPPSRRRRWLPRPAARRLRAGRAGRRRAQTRARTAAVAGEGRCTTGGSPAETSGPPAVARGALSGAVDVARRDDWPQLRRDIDQVRDGYVDVGRRRRRRGLRHLTAGRTFSSEPGAGQLGGASSTAGLMSGIHTGRPQPVDDR